MEVAKAKTKSNKQMNATTQQSNYHVTERIHVPLARHRCFLNKGLKSPAIFHKHIILVLFLAPTSSSLPPCLLGEKLTLSSSEMCHWWLKRKIDVIIRIKRCATSGWKQLESHCLNQGVSSAPSSSMEAIDKSTDAEKSDKDCSGHYEAREKTKTRMLLF